MIANFVRRFINTLLSLVVTYRQCVGAGGCWEETIGVILMPITGLAGLVAFDMAGDVQMLIAAIASYILLAVSVFYIVKECREFKQATAPAAC